MKTHAFASLAIAVQLFGAVILSWVVPTTGMERWNETKLKSFKAPDNTTDTSPSTRSMAGSVTGVATNTYNLAPSSSFSTLQVIINENGTRIFQDNILYTIGEIGSYASAKDGRGCFAVVPGRTYQIISQGGSGASQLANISVLFPDRNEAQSSARTVSVSGSGSIDPGAGAKDFGGFSAPVQPAKTSGVISEASYSLSWSTPNGEFFFSDTGTRTTTNPHAKVLCRSVAVIAENKLISLSIRAVVGPTQPFIVCLVIQGTQPHTILVRGIGPTLAQFGAARVLTDPRIVLFDAQGRTLQLNDDLGGSVTPAQTFTATDAFSLPATSRDAAFVISPPAGPIVQLAGAGSRFRWGASRSLSAAVNCF